MFICKIAFTIKFFLYVPKIICRFIIFALKGKKVAIHSFGLNSNYCFEGTLNQFTWIVENAIFILLEDSQKVYFESDEQIFKVNANQKIFKLICFGVGAKKTAITSIKVIKISQTNFEHLKIQKVNHSICIQQTSLDKPFYSKKKKSPFSYLKGHQICNEKLNPKFKAIKHPLHHLEKINECNSIIELQVLKEPIN